MRYALLLAVIGALLAAVPAHAPNSRGSRDKTISGDITPARVEADVEEAARKLQDAVPHNASYYFTPAYSRREFSALAKYTVFLFAVWTHKAQELPVKRVFIRTSHGDEIRTVRLASWRTQVDQGSATARRYGPYREDGFYLVPTGPMLQEGQIVIDLTSGATEWAILELPANLSAAERRNLSDPGQSSGMPDQRTLQKVIRRDFPGFPVPSSFQ
jgi:hypothetical protein